MDFPAAEERLTTFRQALERVSALAHAKLAPELHGHLERATALVLHRHVWMDEDGRHAQVLSSDGQTWYPCNGHCTCMDAPRAPQGLCKHRLAVFIYRRASELLAQHHGAGPVPAPAALPEAPASVNVRVLIDGRECQVTLRDTDEARLLTRVQAVLARYPAPVCAKPPQIVAPNGDAATATPTCQYHGRMKESTKAAGTFYCPSKMGDGSYCKERFPKK